MIEGLKQLQNRLERMKLSEEDRKTVVVVGFKAKYALYVHEATRMVLKGLPRRKPGKGLYWDPQGKAQAKFLEEPARTMQKQLAEIVRTTYKNTKSLAKSLFAAGLRLQREAQQRVPVDTGNLKSSAFTEFDK